MGIFKKDIQNELASIQSLRPAPLATTRIELPNATIEIDHNCKIYFVSMIDDGQRFEDIFDDMDQHLRAQGYLLQVLPVPVPKEPPKPHTSQPDRTEAAA